jgi:hypothetical protein
MELLLSPATAKDRFFIYINPLALEPAIDYCKFHT